MKTNDREKIGVSEVAGIGNRSATTVAASSNTGPDTSAGECCKSTAPPSPTAIAPATHTGNATSGADLGAAAALIGLDCRAREIVVHHPNE